MQPVYWRPNIDNMGYFPFTIGVFGAMADKDIVQIMDKLNDRIDHWLLSQICHCRARQLLHSLKSSCSVPCSLANKGLLNIFSFSSARAGSCTAIPQGRLMNCGLRKFLRIGPSWRVNSSMMRVPPLKPRKRCLCRSGSASKDSSKATTDWCCRAATLCAAVVVPIVMDTKPTPWADDIHIQIPAKDSKFEPNLPAPVIRSSGKAAEKSTDKSIDKSPEKTVDKAADKSVEKPLPALVPEAVATSILSSSCSKTSGQTYRQSGSDCSSYNSAGGYSKGNSLYAGSASSKPVEKSAND